MAPRNVLLLTFWLLAAAICVTYVAVGQEEPVPTSLSISAQHDDLQRLRDRPSGSWGTYLPRPIISKQIPTTIAKAPSLGGEQSTITNFEKSKRPVVEVAKLEPAVPSSSEPIPLSPAASRKPTQVDSLGVENKQLAVKSIPTKAGKLEPTAKLPSARKKLITERRKSRLARREAVGGLGLFALSGDFGRPTSY
jgi:hypothetical protein